MSYGRILTPRIYADSIRWRIAKGMSGVVSNVGNGLATGYSIEDAFDGRPNRKCVWDTDGESDHVVVAIDLGLTSSNPVNFAAILNAGECAGEARLRVAHHSSAITGAGQGTAVTLAAKLGPIGAGPGGAYIAAANLVATFDTVSDKRYWCIELENYSANFTGDMAAAVLMLGCYYDFPFAPDLEVATEHEFDGVTRRDSAGGQTYSTALHLGPGGTGADAAQPFRDYDLSEYRLRYAARRSWALNWTRIEDTDVSPQYPASGSTANGSILDCWERTAGPHLAFVFAPDSTAAANYGDAAYARFDQDTLSATQTAPRVWSYGLKIREEF